MTKVARFTGVMYFRFTPNERGHVAGLVGEQRVVERRSRSANCFCFATGSVLIPRRCAPASLNSVARSRKWQASLVQPPVIATG